jgi:hypothetical protein
MESIGFVPRKSIFFSAKFHVLGIFIPQKQVKSKNGTGAE